MDKNSSAQKPVVSGHHFLPQAPDEDPTAEKVKADDELQADKPEIKEKSELRLEPNQVGAINASDPKPEPALKSEEKPALKQAPENVKAAAKPSEEDLAHKKNIEKLIQDKDFFLPIAGGQKGKFSIQFSITFIAVLAIGLIFIFLVLKPF